MRTLTTIFSILALTLSLGCSGGGDGDGDGNGPAADANTSSSADADTTNTPDAMPQGRGGAANLGQLCNDATPCATGECIVIQEGATDGLCSLACTMAGMADVCGEADGFPGPGVAYCGLGMAPNLRCAVGCGEQNGGSTSCPSTLTCQDLINGNGMGDLCAPPPPAA